MELLENRRMLAADAGIDPPTPVETLIQDRDRVGHVSAKPSPNASPQSSRELSLLSWNLYLGGDLTPVLNSLLAGDPQQIVQSSSALWQSVLATDFELRAEAIADQIEYAQPTLIGLQEAAIWRTGPVSPTPAENVEYDFTQMLLQELNERGLQYDVVAATQNLDAELTGFTTLPSPENPAGVLEDIRLTDQDVILARTDLPASQLKLSNVQEQNFQAALTFPGGLLTVPRGWNSVDVKVRGKEFRLINTHLEIADFPQLQFAQATELLNTAAATEMAVVLLGDLNTAAVPGQPNDTATYELFIDAGFFDAWISTEQSSGLTCCQSPDLRNEQSLTDSRIDLVLLRGPIDATDAELVGEEQSDRTIPLPNAPWGLWPSDHAGVLVTVELPARQRFVTMASPSLDAIGSDGQSGLWWAAVDATLTSHWRPAVATADPGGTAPTTALPPTRSEILQSDHRHRSTAETSALALDEGLLDLLSTRPW